jgi:hypothetical protein
MNELPGFFLSLHRSDGLWLFPLRKNGFLALKIVSSIYNVAPMGNYGPIYEGATNCKSGHRLQFEIGPTTSLLFLSNSAYNNFCI